MTKKTQCRAFGDDCDGFHLCCGDFVCREYRCREANEHVDKLEFAPKGIKCNLFHKCPKFYYCESHRCILDLKQYQESKEQKEKDSKTQQNFNPQQEQKNQNEELSENIILPEEEIKQQQQKIINIQQNSINAQNQQKKEEILQNNVNEQKQNQQNIPQEPEKEPEQAQSENIEEQKENELEPEQPQSEIKEEEKEGAETPDITEEQKEGAESQVITEEQKEDIENQNTEEKEEEKTSENINVEQKVERNIRLFFPMVIDIYKFQMEIQNSKKEIAKCEAVFLDEREDTDVYIELRKRNGNLFQYDQDYVEFLLDEKGVPHEYLSSTLPDRYLLTATDGSKVEIHVDGIEFGKTIETDIQF